jgi:hypothetical protein
MGKEEEEFYRVRGILNADCGCEYMDMQFTKATI